MMIACPRVYVCLCSQHHLGRKVNLEDIYPATEMFSELMQECSEFHWQGRKSYASVGDFIQTQVYSME